VAHICNPSYSGSREQGDHSSKPARQIIHETLSRRNPSQKRAGGVAQGEGHEFKPQYCKKKKKKRTNVKEKNANENTSTLYLFILKG
jgi:hypothetical protein